MTIDVWMQHPTKRFLAHDMFDSLRRWTGDAIPEEPPPIDFTVAAMDAAGVGFGLLSAWHGPGGPLISNDEVAGWVEQHPDRFAGARRRGPQPADGRGARAAPLRRRARLQGPARHPWLWEAPPTDRRYYPLYAACVELGVPFCTQVGHTGPLRPSETGRPIPYIDQVAIDFPELTIVVRPHRLPVDRGDGRGRAQARARVHRHLAPTLRAATRPSSSPTCAAAAGATRSCSAPTTR